MRVAILVIMVLLVPADTLAEGINLSWNGCGNDGVQNVNFACNTNSGTPFVATASFQMPGPGTPIGNEVVVDLVAAGATLPLWWDFFNTGSCRQSSLTLVLHLSPTNPGYCVDFWNGQAVGAIREYRTSQTTPPSSGPNRVRLLASHETFPLGVGDRDWEYFALSLKFDRLKTVGAQACGGCATPVCIVLSSIKVDVVEGRSYLVTTPLTRNWITWQGGVVDGGCPAATPARNRTWGQVKSLYR